MTEHRVAPARLERLAGEAVAERPGGFVERGIELERLAGEAVAERVARLGHSLRAGGAGVTLAEIIDAAEAVTHVNLGTRSEFRGALSATLVKSRRHLALFDAAFDRLFPLSAPGGVAPGGVDECAAGGGAVSVAAFGADPAALAARLVATHGGFDGELRGERHHLHRVLRAADLARLMSDARKADPELPDAELRERIERLKRLMAAEVRYRLGEPDQAAGDTAACDIEFLNATRNQLEEMREAVRPLARRLAARLAKRRQSRRGRSVNFRRTVRWSLATGGVPIDVAYERARRHRPELFVLCDISGSVADFSVFTLTLMSALSAELSRCRSFVFVDAVDEVTPLLAATGHGIEPWQIMRNTNVIAGEGHSDYGAVLSQFWHEVGDQDLRRESTLLITGDARTNYREARAPMLESISRRCRAVYWLNPEPRHHWDTHDSEMRAYARHCTGVFEVRTVRQLVSCVEELL